MKGIGKGLVGLAVKPTVAAVDLVTKSTEGIANTTAYFQRDNRKKKHFPRYFDERKIVMLYDNDKAHGQYLLHDKLNQGEFKNQTYFWHTYLDDKKSLVLLSTRIFFHLSKPLIKIAQCSLDIKHQFMLTNFYNCYVDKQSLITEIFDPSNNFKITKYSINCKNSDILKKISEKLNNASDLLVQGISSIPASTLGVRDSVVKQHIQKRGLQSPSRLKKEGIISINGKKCKCVVSGGSFCYETNHKNNIALNNGVYCMPIDKLKHHDFALVTKDDVAIYISVPSEKDKQDWIDVCVLNGAEVKETFGKINK